MNLWTQYPLLRTYPCPHVGRKQDLVFKANHCVHSGSVTLNMFAARKQWIFQHTCVLHLFVVLHRDSHMVKRYDVPTHTQTPCIQHHKHIKCVAFTTNSQNTGPSHAQQGKHKTPRTDCIQREKLADTSLAVQIQHYIHFKWVKEAGESERAEGQLTMLIRG